MANKASHQSPAITFDGVSYIYPGASTPALQNITLRVEQGERLGVLGPNGGGKSTLLMIALGLLPGYTGSVSVLGEPPSQARRNARIAAVLQRRQTDLSFPLSVRQMVQLAATHRLAPWRRSSQAIRDRTDRTLDLLAIAAVADDPIGALSGGQMQRALMARALACEPDVLVLDEPTIGIDIEGQARFATLLDTVHRELGMTMVIVSHDVRAIAAGCDRVACLARTIHFHDAPQGLTPQVLAEVFQHDVVGVFGDVHVEAHRAAECPRDHEHGSSHPASGEASA